MEFVTRETRMTMTLFDLAAAEDDRRFSPNCWRVKMALRHKGLQATEIAWRFTEKDRIAFAGSRTVPVLVDGDVTVVDSWEIGRYLERAYPDGPSLFNGPGGEASMLFVKLWAEQTLHPIVLRLILPHLFARLHQKDKAYFRESREARLGGRLEDVALAPADGIAQLHAALAPVRATLAQQPFLGGSTPLYADYIIFGVFQWARATCPISLLREDDPVFAWRERLLDCFDGYARKASAALDTDRLS
jgi:glutathione S-transferase